VSKGFTTQQLKAAQALASGLSQVKAAKESGVSRITVIRWLKIPEFKAKVTQLSKKAEEAETEAFVEVTKEKVRRGAITSTELVELFSGIVRDQEARLGDRIRAGEALARWLGIGESKRYEQPPVLPAKPFGNAEMSHRLDVLRSKAIVASEFLVEQAVQSASQGDIQEATAVLSKSLDLASECVFDVPFAANALAKEGFVILNPAEYSRSLPDGQKSSQHLLQPLDFDRVFGWRWQKRQKSS
jgi:hypothetical protein